MIVNIYIRNSKKKENKGKDFAKNVNYFLKDFQELSPSNQQKFLRFYETKILSQLSNPEDQDLKGIFTVMGNRLKSLAKANKCSV